MPYHEKAEHERTCVGVRVSSVVAMGPCGGIGGAPWEMDLHGVGRVLKLVVRHGSAIDAMSVCYERDGREEQSTRWGGPGGRRSEICLQPDEYLAGVKGHVGHYDNCLVVRSLTFVTNARRSFGPYGKEEGVPFALPAAVAGGRIIGFFGSSGLYLDAIGTYVQMD
ncbi:hypothetical protein BRADI_2g01740v3 [Brachypodium distachyon]|uniref:Jacalin-type lectin domain-containing protein n=2 Tax=Brachypodium distachyon TaxID=15368 RepID=A0A2K2D6F2_BRADI|nr:hypothetical protein BRADI_2g01740v3 [Brachypodium distachyon]